MPPTKDLYEILGVSRTASQDEIRKAYLKLAHKYHPDKTGGDKEAEQKLKEVNAAYDVLKNPEKRSQYDRFGSTDAQGFGGGGFGGFNAEGFGGGFDAPFEDLFDMLFGGQAGRRRSGASAARPGNDLEYRLGVTLAEVAFGAKKTIRFARPEACGDCRGTGATPGSQPEECPQCNGAGQVRSSQGFFSVTRTCPRCQGRGRVVNSPCRRCSGQGRISADRELSVDVPPGVDTGSRLRISGEGEAGQFGGPRGDLYIRMEVEPHPLFERDGTTLRCEVPITITQAALGATIRVPTIEGEVEIKVPAGSQTGESLRLKGMGLPDLRGYRQGDMFVTLKVETPAKLNREQKKLLQQLEDNADSRAYPGIKKFREAVDKLKKG